MAREPAGEADFQKRTARNGTRGVSPTPRIPRAAKGRAQARKAGGANPRTLPAHCRRVDCKPFRPQQVAGCSEMGTIPRTRTHDTFSMAQKTIETSSGRWTGDEEAIDE